MKDYLATLRILREYIGDAKLAKRIAERLAPNVTMERELIAASKSALARLRSYINECGPCDHEVNICVCEIIRDAERLAAAIEAMEAKTAEPAQQLRTCCIGCGALHERPMSSYCQRCADGRAREFDHHTGLSRP